MSNNNYSCQRLSLPNTEWFYSASSLSRTLSPVAFFHDGISTSEIDLRYNIISSQRRAQAIATAPRRKRYDDEENDNDEQKKDLLGYIKTPAVPIPVPTKMNQETQSLPQTRSGISFHIDPPSRIDTDELDYLYK